ncbi:MAG: hemerythrin domain-containing protein [Pseudomonadota bacterium]
MLNDFIIRTEDMPSELGVLLNKYPRESWDAHPGFKDKTRQWLAAHHMFRRLSNRIREDAESYLDHNRSGDDYAARLSYFGNALVGNLHGHHGWEDNEYFPELASADSRFSMGLEILEKDHKDLDLVLDQFTRSANRAIKLIHLDEATARDEVGEMHDIVETIEAFLERHLGDEEDLAVPIILHHRLRG